MVRRSRDDLRPRCARLVARGVPAELGGGHRSARPRAGRSVFRRLRNARGDRVRGTGGEARRGPPGLGRPARSPVEGQDPDPRPARLRHHAGRVGDDHRARSSADPRHGRRVPVAAAARRPDEGIRAERPAPRSEDRAAGRAGDDLGPARHSAQPARRAAAGLRVPAERHAGDRRRDRRSAERASPRSGAGVRRIRGQRRGAARGKPRRLPVAGAARSPRGLAAAVGARGPARDERRRRGLDLLAERGADWMRYWDQTVRAHGR